MPSNGRHLAKQNGAASFITSIAHDRGLRELPSEHDEAPYRLLPAVSALSLFPRRCFQVRRIANSQKGEGAD